MVSIRRQVAIIIAVICISAVLSGLPFAAETKEFSFVHFTDVHVPTYGFAIGMPLTEENLMPMHNQQRIQQCVKECLAMKPRPAFVINSGDTGDVGWIPLLKLYQKLMQPLVSAGIPVYTVVGNHDLDYAGIGRDDLAEIFDPLGPSLIGCNGTRYSFDYGDCHLVFLNNCPMCGVIRLSPMDLKWLHSDLEKVDKGKRILVFLHAFMIGDDTYHLVEMLQHFRHPVIFRCHKHSEALEKWGGVSVMVTGALYSGNPEAGSYSVVNVSPEKIAVRTRDFAEPAGKLSPEKILDPPPSGPELHIIEPRNNAIVSESVTLVAEINPLVLGKMKYLIPGFKEWTPIPGKDGRWETVVPVPPTPGWYFLALQFNGKNGAIVWEHVVFQVYDRKVHEVWTKDLGSAIQGAPAIWQDLVIVPTLERGVYALRLDDGTEVWHRKVIKGQVLGRVVVDGIMVYYGAGRTVYASEAGTGKHLWQVPIKGTIVAGLTAAEGKLYVPAGEHKLYCLDTRSGKIRWDYTVDLPILMEPAADGSTVFFGAMDGYFRALDAVTGKELWKYPLSSKEDDYSTAPFWPPVLAGDKVIVSKRPAQKDEKNLVAFHTSSGKVCWSRPVMGWPSRLIVSPEKGILYTSYIQEDRGGIQSLSVEDGSLLWNKVTGVDMYAGIATRGVVLVRDGNSLCCVEAGTGKVQWVYNASIGPQGSLYGASATVVKDDLIIVGTMDGRVFALKW